MSMVSARQGWKAKLAGLCVALLLALGIVAAGTAAASPASPQDTIRGFYATLLATMKEGPALGQNGRYARLAPVVDQVFDIPLMTRLAVGPSWAGLTPTQQRQVTEAFAHYVSATYADRFDRYSGDQLQVIGEQPYGEQVIVQTQIVKPGDDPVSINYLMGRNEGSWQVADVYLDGTISQLATQRSEFYSILRREGVDGLIMRLNHKVDLLKQSANNASWTAPPVGVPSVSD